MAMQAPKAGQLKVLLRFDQLVTGPNIGGVIDQAWTSFIASCRASVEPTRGGEEIIAGRMSGKVSYDIWVRSSIATRGLTNAHRAVNLRTGEIYNIAQPIDPNSKREWLFIQAVSSGNALGIG